MTMNYRGIYFTGALPAGYARDALIWVTFATTL